MSALTKTDWRKLLDEYRRLAIAENVAGRDHTDGTNRLISRTHSSLLDRPTGTQ